MIRVLAIHSALSVAVMSALWFRQRETKNATSVDAVWALGIGVGAACYAWAASGNPSRRIMVAFLVGVWSIRLSTYLYLNRVRTGKEDGRYTRFREKWSPAAFFGLFMAQAALVILLPLTFWSALRNLSPFPSVLDLIGLSAWGLAAVGEASADRQLARFRKDPANRGKTCRIGLWRYSRHPNYFFEWIQWCAYLPFAFGSSGFAYAFIGPALLLILLLKVSGVPPTEEQALISRGDDYRLYQETTSVFFPWFPKGEAKA